MEKKHRGVVLRIVSAYRTVLTSAVLVLASFPPIDLLTMQSTHSYSAPGGAWQGRLSVRQWALNSLLTRWSLSCSSLNKYGCLSNYLFIPALVGSASRFVKFKAEKRFRGRCIGLREGIFVFNRYA